MQYKLEALIVQKIRFLSSLIGRSLSISNEQDLWAIFPQLLRFASILTAS